MIYIIKNVFTWSVIAMTIVWSMGIAALVPIVANAAECPTLVAGDLFKVPNNSAVYLLNANMERMYFPHSSVYYTWYEDFASVVEIPNTCVDNYPSPSASPYGVNYRPGSKLIKVQISPSVYVVEPGNKKSKIGSEVVAVALYGDDWASKVVDIADVFWPNYTATGNEITAAIPHDGMLVKVAGGEVYKIKDNLRYPVDGTIRSNADVQVVSQSVLDSVADAPSSVTADSVYVDPVQTSTTGAEQEETIISKTIIETKNETIVEVIKNIRITDAPGESTYPAIVWTGTNYGIVWADARSSAGTEIFFALLDDKGNKIVEDTQITDTPTLISTNPEIVWNGNEFAIVYNEYSDGVAMKGTVNFMRINLSGSKIGNTVEITNIVDKTYPKVAWSGNGYGIIWRNPTNLSAKTYFSYLDLEGNISTSQVRVITVEASKQTEIIWDGSKFALVYRKSKEIIAYGGTATYTVGTYLHRIDENGNATRSELYITGKEALAAIWDGLNYATVEDNNTFSSFSSNGNFAITNAAISSEGLSDPDIISGSTKYGIVGQQAGFIRFIEMNKDGTVQQAVTQINDISNTASSTPRISWSGDKYGIIWSDTQDGNSGGEIYFRSINSQ